VPVKHPKISNCGGYRRAVTSKPVLRLAVRAARSALAFSQTVSPYLLFRQPGTLHQDRKSLPAMAFGPGRDRQQGET
jgi:hypothetical protein